MMISSRYRFLDTVDYLIKAGGDLNITDKNGETALMYAINPLQGSGGEDKDNMEVIKLLVTSGANLKIRDRSGNTVFNHLILSNKVNVFDYLLKTLGEENLLDSLNVENALDIASIGTQRQYFLELLKNNGVKVNLPE